MQRRILFFVAAVAATAACASGGGQPQVALAPADSCAKVLTAAAAQNNHVADYKPKQKWWELPNFEPTDSMGNVVPEHFIIYYLIDTTGRVDSAKLSTSENIGPRYGAELRRLANDTWRYTPAIWAGCHVPYIAIDTMKKVSGSWVPFPG